MASFTIPTLTFECLDFKVESKRSLYGQFVLSPLEAGQGITLGNALRRTLLSDLDGIAITSVQILGVNHEFATIIGVQESVLDILLNLKQLVFSSEKPFQGPQIAHLHFSGPGDINSSFIQVPPFIKVVDPGQHIATVVSNNLSLDFILTLDSGRGYRLGETPKHSELTVDYLPLDAVFMPVTRVNYLIDKVSLHESRKERLTLEIWTNGSIHPRNALTIASNILINLLISFRDPPLLIPTIPSEPPSPIKFDQILIEDLELSVRAYNCLKRANIHTVQDLLAYSQQSLLEIKNFGQKSADEVVCALQSRLGIIFNKPGQ